MNKYRAKTEAELRSSGWNSDYFYSDHYTHSNGEMISRKDHLLAQNKIGEELPFVDYYHSELVEFEIFRIDSVATSIRLPKEACVLIQNEDCNHIPYNASFMHIRMVCKTCDQELS